METDEKKCSTCATVKPLARYGYIKALNRYKAQCKDCGKAVINALRYGSAAERYKEKERVRNDGRRDYIKQWQADHREVLNERQRLSAKATISCAGLLRSVVYFLPCQHTGVVFVSKSPDAKYCPEGRRLTGLNRAKTYEAKLHAAKSLQWVCKQCEQEYAPVYGEGRRCYCSAACLHEALTAYKRCTSTHRKRARYYGGAYEPISISKVMRRDNWTCQICGVATPLSKRGTFESDAPELDHIIPLSKGGGHIMSNVQCACRQCNGSKGNKIL